MKKIFYILLIVLVSNSCNPDELADAEVVARVYGKALTRTELTINFPENLSGEDSVRLVKEQAELWVKRQLLLKKAELNVGENQEINELVNKYKEQLLIENYLRLLVERKAEIKPSEEQVRAFYEENKKHYKLPENLLKGVLVVLPSNAPNKQHLHQLLRSAELDQSEIETYCLQNAAKVDFFTDEWVAFRLIKKHLPSLDQSEKFILQNRPYYEVEDSLFHYILKVEDYQLVGSTSPLSYVYKELEEYLLNINKVTYLQKMEENLYRDAERKNLIQYND